MTFKTEREAFVWIWLPGETEPVVAGRLEADNGNIMFNYGKSYLERVNDSNPAIAIYEPELPLRTGVLPLLEGLNMPGCIRDAAPDAWGRRVIINKKLGLTGAEAEAYAKEVVVSDFEAPGDDDVFTKIRKDFDAKGVAQSDHQIRRTMSELLARAAEEVRQAK